MKQAIIELEINISTLHFLIETSKSGEKVISKCQKLLMSLIDVPTAQWGQYLHWVSSLLYIHIPQWYMKVRRVKIKVFKKQLFDDVST